MALLRYIGQRILYAIPALWLIVTMVFMLPHMVRGDPVAKVVASHYPATLELAIVALLICAAIAIPAGVLAAHRRGERTDHAVGVLTLFGLSIPNFALGPILILVFSVILGWLPVSGRGGILHLVLPAFTLGAALAVILTRMVRTSVIEELSADYIRTARAKGL